VTHGSGDEVVEALLARARWRWTSDLPTEVAEALTQRLVDTIGCAAAGRAHQSSAVAVRVACDEPGPHPIWFSGRRSSLSGAAFANGVMARCLDLNDTYFSTQGGGHPSDYIPALLAVGESVAASGKDLLRGLSVLYDVFCCLADAWKPALTDLDYVTAGSVAVAVAGSLLTGLDEERIRAAVSLALVANVALGETRVGEVSMWKNCASSWAACAGLRAIGLARAGMDGPAKPFVGRRGFLAVAAPEFDASFLHGEPRHAVLRTDVKSYPAGFLGQSAIEAALRLRTRLDGTSDIASVDVAVPALAASIMAGDPEKWSPATRETADHSIPFVVAAALVYGEVGERTYDAATLASPEILGLLGRTHVHADEGCTRMWPDHLRSVVRVEREDGSEIQVEAVDFAGHHAQPFTKAGLDDKFRRNAQDALGGRTDELLALLWRIRELDDVSILGASLRG
jgi:2-methylcitrate dehydratase